MRRGPGDRRRYSDILDQPHHVSKVHPQMSIHDRAAQFAPFAALTGHKEALAETERRPEDFVQMEEDRREELDEQLMRIRDSMGLPLPLRPRVSVTYFQPDERKAGGSYRTVTGRVRRVNLEERRLVFEDGETVDLRAVVDILWPEGRI